MTETESERAREKKKRETETERRRSNDVNNKQDDRQTGCQIDTYKRKNRQKVFHTNRQTCRQVGKHVVRREEREEMGGSKLPLVSFSLVKVHQMRKGLLSS